MSISTAELPRREIRPPAPPSISRTSSFGRLRPKTKRVPALEMIQVSQGASRPLESTVARSRSPARASEGRVINKRSYVDCSKNRLDTEPAALSERDYDTNPTELYLAIQNKKWDEAVKRCVKFPREAATWVFRRERNNSLRWRLLPLHAAIVFRASTNVVEALLKAYPLGARCTDDQRKYPLHLCFRRNCSVDAVRLLLDAFPECANINDDKGRAPMTLVSQSTHPEKEILAKLLERYGATLPSSPPLVQGSAHRSQSVSHQNRDEAECSKDSLALCRPDDVCDEGIEIEYDQEKHKFLENPPPERAIHDLPARSHSSTLLEHPSTKPSIVDMAPASLREQMRERMERRRKTNPTGDGQNHSRNCLSSFLEHDELASDVSVSVSSSICSSTANSFIFSSTSQNAHSGHQRAQSAALPLEDQTKISTESQKDACVESFESAGMDAVQSGIRHFSKKSSEDSNCRYGCDEPEIYTSKSMLTQSTADLTSYDPISGCDEGSLGHVSRELTANEGAGDLATPNLMKKAEQFFSSPIVGTDDTSVATYQTNETQKLLLSATLDDQIGTEHLRSNIEHSPSSSSVTQSKFDRIMAKYDQLERRSEPESLETSRLGTLMGSQRQRDQDAPRFHQIRPEPSGNSERYIIRKIGSEDSDAVSTLSRATGASTRTGMTTIGSVTISTTNSAEVEDYVQSVVSNIVAKEIDGSLCMKAELEKALKSKIKLERKVEKLMKSSKARYEELKQLRLSKHAHEKEINREVEIHLARKASELQTCVKFALKQSEDAKQRAVKLAECKADHEIRLLRSQLMKIDAEHNGIKIDKKLQRSLEVVELNRKELLETAASDAQQAMQMNKHIEESFSSAVKEFESWSDKGMIRR